MGTKISNRFVCKGGVGMKDKIKFAGAEVVIQVIDKDTGKVVDERKSHNLVLNNMKKHIRYNLLGWNSWWGIWSSPFVHIGTNGTAPEETQTSLTEQYRSQGANRNEWKAAEQRREIETLFTDFTEEVHICEAGVSTDTHAQGWTLKNRITFPYIVVDQTKNLKVIMYFYPGGV